MTVTIALATTAAAAVASITPVAATMTIAMLVTPCGAG
jgi:hypothetical protein